MEIVPADEGGFVQTPMPGIQIRYLKGKNTFLVKMAPKSSLPSHEHKYNEQCLVLEGSIQDEDGQIVGAGDYVFMPKGSTRPCRRSDSLPTSARSRLRLKYTSQRSRLLWYQAE